MNDEILTRQEAAKFLKLPQKTLDYLVQTDQLPFSRVSRRNVRFLKERLIDYMRQRESIAYHRPTGKAE